MADPIKVRRRAKGARPYFFEDPSVDKLLAIVMALAGEVSVLHDRLDSALRLAEKGEPLSRAALEGFQPDASVRAERDAWRDEFLERILRIVHTEVEGVEEANSPETYRAAVERIARD